MTELAITDRPAPAVARVTINRPDRRNALGPEVRDALIAAMSAVLADDTVRSVVLCGAKGVFCSGGDISTMKRLEATAGRARLKAHHHLVRLIAEADKPIVAAVEGFAVGAGGGLALLCDLIVMGQSAQIGFPFFRLGLVPDYGILYTLPKRVGMGVARQAVLLGTMFKGEEALRVGLADQAVPDADVMAEAIRAAAEMGSHARAATALAKRLLATMPASLEGALEMEALAQPLLITSDDFVEGTAAFMEKRKPRF